MERKLDKYRIDWKDIVHGHFEVEASSSNEALEKFKSLSKKKLYKESNWNTDGTEIDVKFIENKDAPFDIYTPNELDDYGNDQIKEWDDIWRPYF